MYPFPVLLSLSLYFSSPEFNAESLASSSSTSFLNSPGQVWKRYNIFEGVEGLDNSQDEIKMEEEPMKEEDATGCRGRDASPDRPDELAKKRRLDGP